MKRGSVPHFALITAPVLTFLPLDATPERGYASVLSVRLSVRPSDSDVQVSWSHKLEFFENNLTAE